MFKIQIINILKEIGERNVFISDSYHWQGIVQILKIRECAIIAVKWILVIYSDLEVWLKCMSI